VLDVGCGGGGLLLRDALASGVAVTGLDHSAEMVRLAEERAPRARVVVGTAEQLPFADAAFTAISMSIVFFFLTDPVGVLRECRRVLAPGGRLAVYATAPALRGTPAAPEPLASRGHFYADDELAALARQRGSRRWPWSTTTAVSCSPRALKRARSGRALGQLQHEPAGRLRHRPRVPAPAHLRRAPAPPPG
jgi:SAM-dependent methyltransferase